MKFDQTTKRILCAKPDHELGKEIQTEIAKSDEYAQTASEWKTFGTLVPEQKPPPLSTDFLILNEAEKVLESRNSRKSNLIQRIVWPAAAACLILSCLIGLIIIRSLSSKPNQTQLASSSIPKKTNNVEANETITVSNKEIISWKQVDMRDDFFELETEMELNLASINDTR